MTVSNQSPNGQTTLKSAPAFRWSYIAFPLLILTISVILAAAFFPKLPSQMAYHFDRNGSPDRWVGRGLFVLVTLLPQFIFTLFAAAVTWGMGKLSARLGAGKPAAIRLEGIIRLMGNMLVLPQAVLAFAVLDIFAFNAFQVRLIPLWVFAVFVMVIGGVLLGIFFARAVRHALRPTQ